MKYKLGHEIYLDRHTTETRLNPFISARTSLSIRCTVMMLLTRDDESTIAYELRDSLDDHIRDTSIDEEDKDDT